jgi:hypothetical protein
MIGRGRCARSKASTRRSVLTERLGRNGRRTKVNFGGRGNGIDAAWVRAAHVSSWQMLELGRGVVVVFAA